ncbi:hypothetical protein KEJ18_07410 [Candidatus Bathyarchaeota archaeon]|nr:hypothetical protein [Candidatus Bathyarchaeota archaeon]
MGQSVSIYFPPDILKWLDDQREQEKRSRSNQVIKILGDFKNGRLTTTVEASREADLRKTRQPPSART